MSLFVLWSNLSQVQGRAGQILNTLPSSGFLWFAGVLLMVISLASLGVGMGEEPAQFSLT